MAPQPEGTYSEVVTDLMKLGSGFAVASKKEPKTKSVKGEKSDLDDELKKAEIKDRQADTKAKELLYNQRIQYGDSVKTLVRWWLPIVLAIILISAIFDYCGDPLLSDNVLITLITGTTASIISLYAIVIYGIFGRN